jgi:hypothetical protein
MLPQHQPRGVRKEDEPRSQNRSMGWRLMAEVRQPTQHTSYTNATRCSASEPSHNE